MLRLEEVNGKNVWDNLKLTVAENQLALDFIRTLPCGKAEYCWLSYEPENEIARQLYRSFGFVETGDMDGEELIAVLRL